MKCTLALLISIICVHLNNQVAYMKVPQAYNHQLLHFLGLYNSYHPFGNKQKHAGMCLLIRARHCGHAITSSILLSFTCF